MTRRRLRVVKTEWVGACRYTGYEHKSIKLTLQCGHELVRKASVPIPAVARCIECERKVAK